MTRETVMDKARLGAFLDGELSPEDAAAVVMHLADTPGDQAWVDDLMAANAALTQAFSVPLHEPVPPALRALILGDEAARDQATVLRFRARMRRTPALVWSGLAGGVLAAGLTVALLLPLTAPDGLRPGPLAANSPLQTALATLPSGVTQPLADGSEVMILASLPTPDGFCREIEVTRPADDRLEAALTCQRGAGWSVQVVIVERLSDASVAQGFGTASGAEAQGFAAFLDRVGAGPALTPAEEAAAIARDWAR
jgi:hypothetical protein